MLKTTLILMLCGFSFATFAQKKLILQKKQIGYIKTNVDQLTLDSLVMKDSSKLFFGGKKVMYLQVNHLVVGKGCILDGTGENGKNGDILPYTGLYNPRLANNTIRGDYGWNGSQGTNLFLTVKDIVLQDSLIIFAPGGNGGNGSVVPTLNVFTGRPGVSTSSYNANNPYNGLPGLGGNGGRGGNVHIAYSSAVEKSLGAIVVMNYGGQSGQMGDINPMNLIAAPTSVLDRQARVNDPRFQRQVRRDGRSGKVRLMKLAE